MCGINGIFSFGGSREPVDAAELERTRDRMAPRGPDGAGLWLNPDGRLGFGHRRLAIIDPTPAGAQPMLLDGGRFAITFNGEIYNFAELRAEMQRAGDEFLTGSDTEVLLHLYRRHGAEMVRRLRGMFAFGIWDEARRELFLARDPYGIKPLYYTSAGGTFRFASQVKALLASERVDGSVDPAGLVGFLLWGSVPEPLTICSGIRSLPAGGHMLVRDSEGPAAPVRYWTLARAIRNATEAARDIPAGDEIAVLRAALRDSVRAHMVADVPVGAFLSAGLDSSTIVGLARQVSGSTLQTITLTSKAMAGTHVDEAPGALALADFLRVRHSLLEIDTEEFDDDLAGFLAAMDQPTIDGLNTWFVSKAARQAGLKVALSGLGGDELLGGYWTFADIPASIGRHRILRAIPGAATLHRHLNEAHLPFFGRDPKEAARLAHPDSFAGAYAVERGLLRPWQLKDVLDGDVLRAGVEALAARGSELEGADFEALTPFGKVMVLEGTHYMRNQLLRDSDWAGMAQSLEIRVPLVDRHLTEQIGGLAALGRLGNNKVALGQVLDPPLPRGILGRAKTGFTLPIWKWLRKSGSAQGWKSNALLRGARVHDFGRWGYTVLCRGGYCRTKAGRLTL